MIRRATALSTMCALCIGHAASGADRAELFATDAPFVMQIFADLGELCPEPGAEDCPDLPAVIAYRESDGRELRIEAALRIRGRWKSDTADCTLPALFLIFAPEATAGTVFEGQETLPLTTHCRIQLSYEQYLLKEYLAHRIYNLLTDKSLGARLARISWHDTEGRPRLVERYGFFTEHFLAAAARVAAEVWNPEEWIDPLTTDPFDAAVLAVFQYMIGNTDWSIVAGHNIMLLRGADWIAPVPYDLDFSGLVNAEYAGPPPDFPLRSVTQRLYRGFCRPDLDWQAVFEHFTSRRDAILGLVTEIPGLSLPYQRRTIRYLESFFRTLESPELREERIIANCRQAPQLP